MQANATLRREVFSEFAMSDEFVQFRLNLHVLQECLAVFGSSSLTATTLSMYMEEDSPKFLLLLEENRVLTECELGTVEEEEEPEDFAAAFRAAPTLNRAILLSEFLKDALAEITDMPGAGSVGIEMGPDAPNLRFTAEGAVGTCDVEFTRDSAAFVSFDSECPKKFLYRLALLQQASKALGVAQQTYLRMNAAGVLSVQHMIPVPHAAGVNTFVDFILFPETEAEESAAALPDLEQAAAAL